MNAFPKIILASKSPRRQELLRLMDIDFRMVLKEVDESYPDGLSPAEIALYIAQQKAEAFDEEVTDEVIENFIRDFKGNTLSLDNTLYSFMSEDEN